ncbi:MAG: RsmB/NOP family class I SAM-dependent RNA methyltransferase [Pseudomonadota bacterium]
MQLGGRLQAAIEVVTDITAHHRPASDALRDWGRTHRFAGSGDRAVIGNIVFDVLRKRLSLAHGMGSDTPRALVLGAAPSALGLSVQEIAAAVDGSRHAPEAITEAETSALRAAPDLANAPVHVQADVPDWLMPSLQRRFEGQADLIAEGRALAERAPLDVRINTLKADRDRVAAHFKSIAPRPTPHAPHGLRFDVAVGQVRLPNVEADPAHGKGWIEVQDEGSQIAAALAGASPRAQVIDLCAGAGGKTLALGAAMENTGQIYAYDRDRQQLRPIFERIRRAGLRQVQVMTAGDREALNALAGRFDLVFVDAPCSGSGTWRRKPDAKWRLKPKALETRQAEQREVLEIAAPLVQPGGRLAYVTCSLLPEENEDQVSAFLQAHPEFSALALAPYWSEHLSSDPAEHLHSGAHDVQLTPLRHGTDGFFIALLERSATH